MNDLNALLTRLLIESYDKGVADSKAAAMEAIAKGVVIAAAAEREACIDIVAMHGGSVEIEAAIRARGQA